MLFVVIRTFFHNSHTFKSIGTTRAIVCLVYTEDFDEDSGAVGRAVCSRSIMLIEVNAVCKTLSQNFCVSFLELPL